jgi:hypothetical protein
MRFARFAVVFLSLLSLACGDDRPVLRVGTNGTSFELMSVPSSNAFGIAAVPYTTANHGDASAVIPQCGTHPSVVLETLVDGNWQLYASAACVEFTASRPIDLRAGDSRRDEVMIGAPGHYRIRVPYWWDGSPNMSFSAVSNEFDVH